MKKSKLIVPAALAVMILSTAASVTGTVAWFTSNRAVSISTSNFTVSSIDGNLSIYAKNICGTVLTNSYVENAVVAMPANSLFTDGSVDHTATGGQVYRKGYKTGETNFVVSPSTSGELLHRTVGTSPNEHDYYFAICWNYKFNYEFGGDATAVNLYFDLDASEVQIKNTTSGEFESYTDDSTGYRTIRGFRMAFIGDGTSSTSGNSVSTKVWAPNQTLANCGYINGTGKAVKEKGVTGYDAGTYTESDNILMHSGTANYVQDDAQTVSAATGGKNYLGQFVKPASGSSDIIFTCYAWFEGTDPNIVNTATTVFDEVKASMRFFIRPTSA